MFHTTWEHVRDSVRHAVAWGLVHRDLAGVEAIGVDEIQWRRGHHYLTLVYQIDAGCRRLLWIGRERTEDSLRRGLELLGQEFCSGLRFVCSDLWQPYLKVLAEQAGGAIHVLDRFHIMKQLRRGHRRGTGREARRTEARRLRAGAQAFALVLAQTAREPDRPADGQADRACCKYNLQSVRAYLHREDFQRFWEYQSPAWAGTLPRRMVHPRHALRDWSLSRRWPAACGQHRPLLLNWFRAKGTIRPASSRASTTKRN